MTKNENGMRETHFNTKLWLHGRGEWSKERSKKNYVKFYLQQFLQTHEFRLPINDTASKLKLHYLQGKLQNRNIT